MTNIIAWFKRRREAQPERPEARPSQQELLAQLLREDDRRALGDLRRNKFALFMFIQLAAETGADSGRIEALVEGSQYSHWVSNALRAAIRAAVWDAAAGAPTRLERGGQEPNSGATGAGV